jgi:hypothetical protein
LTRSLREFVFVWELGGERREISHLLWEKILIEEKNAYDRYFFLFKKIIKKRGK